MDLTDEIEIKAPRGDVFRALQDAEILKAAIPGCETLNAESDTEFDAVVAAKVGPLKARFKGKARLEDINPDHNFSLHGEGRGGPAGHAKAKATIELEDSSEGTLLRYNVHADVGGKLAQLGGALVQNTAKNLAAEFFSNLEAQLDGGDANAEGSDGAEPAHPNVSPPNQTWLWVAGGVLGLAAIAWLLV